MMHYFNNFKTGVILSIISYLLGILISVQGHGAMNYPPSRNAGALPGYPIGINASGCEGLACMWFSQGCTIGCDKCVDTFNNFMNFTSACGVEYPNATLPKELRTYNVNNTKPGNLRPDWTLHHPWRHPGAAPVLDACGVSGGSTVNNDKAGGIGTETIAHKQGVFGSKWLPRVTWSNTTWVAGSVVEVSWGITANHGGGYSYRLCPSSEPLTEECFQKTPLEFSGTSQFLRWNNGHEVVIDAMRISKGTVPEGSQWTRNPIPSCGGIGVGKTYSGKSCSPPQFPPPEGCDETCKLKIPDNLPPGQYVIGCTFIEILYLTKKNKF
eukprot:GSMAST32.ASY1.ANO1.281.1 assembled CDS